VKVADIAIDTDTEAVDGRWKIGAVARAVGLSEHRIRAYERAGFIGPARDPRTGDRLFTAGEVSQLRMLKRLVQEGGYTLATLRDAIRRAPCWALVDCAARHHCPVPRDALTPCYEQRARRCGCLRNGLRPLCDLLLQRRAFNPNRRTPRRAPASLSRRPEGNTSTPRFICRIVHRMVRPTADILQDSSASRPSNARMYMTCPMW
jgi:MerR family transcriptional regulator/heat shock protein HspR